jgi:hypothetical protein
VAVRVSSPPSLCGGSILDGTHVLTAAHCVVATGTTTPLAPGVVSVLAGVSNLATIVSGRPLPAGAQSAPVASLRVHPNYDVGTDGDDIAVLTLGTALVSTPTVRAIALAPVGAAPAPGTVLGVSGFGQQRDDAPQDGKLYSANLTAIADDQCRSLLSPNASAGTLCAQSPTQATCHGDSGGPLVSSAGGVRLVGVVDAGPRTGCATGPGLFADVTAPEVRAFIDGATSIPLGPRISAPAALSASNPPVQGDPLTCLPGTWSGAPAFTYTFQVDATGQVLQSGPGAVFVPTAAQLGAGIVCVVQAANAGGTASARSGTTPPIGADAIRPRAAIRSLRCRGRRCVLRFDAADPNSRGALTLHVSAEQRVRAVCHRGHGRHRHAVRCTRVRRRTFAVKSLGGIAYEAIASRLPLGRVLIRVTAVDAVGNSQRPSAVARVTIHAARTHRHRRH